MLVIKLFFTQLNRRFLRTQIDSVLYSLDSFLFKKKTASCLRVFFLSVHSYDQQTLQAIEYN